MPENKTQPNKDDILNKYHSLSPELQDAIFSMDTANAIQRIGSDNKLTVFQIGVLADETGLLLLGVTHPTKFITNLTERMNIDREKAKKVSDETNQLIFSKVREALKKLNETKPETEKEYYKVKGSNTKKDELENKDRLSKLIRPASNPPQKQETPETKKETATALAGKDILTERNKDDVLRMKPSVSDVSSVEREEKIKKLPTEQVDNKKTGLEKTGPRSEYSKSGDPYREPY